MLSPTRQRLAQAIAALDRAGAEVELAAEPVRFSSIQSALSCFDGRLRRVAVLGLARPRWPTAADRSAPRGRRPSSAFRVTATLRSQPGRGRRRRRNAYEEPKVCTTLRWRGLDSNFQYAGAGNLVAAHFMPPNARDGSVRPLSFSDGTTPCIEAAWTRPPRPQSV